MGISHSDLPLPQKLLLLLKCHSGRKRSFLVDPQKLSEQWGHTPDRISHDLNELRRDGKICLCDDRGVRVEPDGLFSVGQQLVQIIIDEAGYIPWDKPIRRTYARMLGAKLKCFRLIIQRTGVIEVERNEHGWPTGLRITDFDAAQAYIGKGKVALKTQHYGCHYYRYVKGLKKPGVPVESNEKPLKRQRYTNSHRLLERVIQNNGDWWVRPVEVCREFGFHRSGLYHHVRKLDGIIQYENGRIRLIDPEKARLFLSQVQQDVPTTTAVTSSSPHTSSSVVSTNLTTASTGKDSVDAFVVKGNTRIKRPNEAATFFFLHSLLIRRRLELEIAQRLVWYPRNYRLHGKGREKMAHKYIQMKGHDEFTEEADRRQQGQMWSRQKAIVLRILTSLKDLFGWPTIIGDELVQFAAKQMRGALPSVESPENKAAEELADWMDDSLPEDEIALEWIQEFADCAGVEFTSEFVARGGVNFLMYLMYSSTAEMPVHEDAYAWYVHLTLAYANQHRFNPKYPESFNVNINDAVKAVTDNTSWASGDTVIEALTRYLHYGGHLSSIRHRAYWLVERLNEVYPRREDNGNLIWHRTWDSIVSDDGMILLDVMKAHPDEFSLLCDWMDEYTPKIDEAGKYQPEKFSLRWYEMKLESAKRYGMPGDLEALNVKIKLLKEWKSTDVKKQKNELVPGLNKPDRYSNPDLNWQQWDILIRNT